MDVLVKNRNHLFLFLLFLILQRPGAKYPTFLPRNPFSLQSFFFTFTFVPRPISSSPFRSSQAIQFHLTFPILSSTITFVQQICLYICNERGSITRLFQREQQETLFLLTTFIFTCEEEEGIESGLENMAGKVKKRRVAKAFRNWKKGTGRKEVWRKERREYKELTKKVFEVSK